jgi:hypothetical protein
LAPIPQTQPEIDDLIAFVLDVRRIAFRLVEAQAEVNEGALRIEGSGVV